MTKPNIIVCGILDTKGKEIKYIKEMINKSGGAARIMEISVGNEVGWADIPLSEILMTINQTSENIVGKNRDEASEIIIDAGKKYILKLYKEGLVDGIISYGGSMGATIATSIMKELPIGVPKFMLTTMASGDVRSYIGTKDITLMYPIAEAGLNRVTKEILARAAAGVVAMSKKPKVDLEDSKPLVGCMMFGVTTPCVLKATELIDKAGKYDVIINHATGAGGQSMEEMIAEGFIEGFLDITTSELCDEHFGGVLSAGAERCSSASINKIPQVIAPGGLDIINFGAENTVPKEQMDRTSEAGKGLYFHNANVTCVGTSPSEAVELAEDLARKINMATAPVTLCVPMKGWSATDLSSPNKELGWSGPGPGVCWVADEKYPNWSKRSRVFCDYMKKNLDLEKNNIELIIVDKHINEPEFAELMAQILLDMLDGNYIKGKYSSYNYIIENL